jgi:hypothetical protein
MKEKVASLKKINMIEKSLANLTKTRKEKTQINESKDERGR